MPGIGLGLGLGLTSKGGNQLTVLSNQLLWLKADEGVTESGGAVSQWNDFSGNNNHPVQATPNDRPTITAAQVNSKPSITSDGVSDYMSLTTPIVTGVASDTYFFVAYRAASAFRRFTGKDSADSDYFSSNSTIQSRIKISGINNNFTLSAISQAYHIFEWVRNAAGAWLHFVDGVASSSNPISAGGAIDIDNIWKSGTVFTDVPLAEIIMYSDEKSSADRILIRNYLATKYDISV